jgi:hypothetical protein
VRSAKNRKVVEKIFEVSIVAAHRHVRRGGRLMALIKPSDEHEPHAARGPRLIHDTIEPSWIDDLRSDAVSLTEYPTKHSIAGADNTVAKVSDCASRGI